MDIEIRKLTPELTEDWSALMDTSHAVAMVTTLLLAVTIILSVVVFVVYYRKNNKQEFVGRFRYSDYLYLREEIEQMIQCVTFREMSEDEYIQWKEGSVYNYAQALISAGKCSENDAKTKAESDFLRVWNRISPQNNLLFIAENTNGVPVGMIWCEIKNPNLAFIAEIFVYGKYRGMGYGNAIIKELERNLKQRKVISVALHVFEYNIPAVKLYEKCGFNVDGNRDRGIYMKKQFDV